MCCGPCALQTLCARLAEIMRLLGELARTGAGSAMQTVAGNDVDSWRRLISQKVEDIQGLIESSKFELDAFKLSEIQKFVGDAQIIFILLLTLAHERRDVTAPNVVRAAAVELDDAMAKALLALSTRIASGSQPAATNLEDMIDSLERHVAVCTNAPGETPPPLSSLSARPFIARSSPPSNGFPWTLWIPELDPLT